MERSVKQRNPTPQMKQIGERLKQWQPFWDAIRLELELSKVGIATRERVVLNVGEGVLKDEGQFANTLEASKRRSREWVDSQSRGMDR